ncbi:MAG: glycosyltransferase family 4 protein [Bdellovibrionales bacterium]|jgi:glycosyltransferase involved in cell wall biosynthesis
MIDKRNLAALPARLIDRMGLKLPSRYPVRFIIERGNWSIKWDGTYIAGEIEKKYPGVVRVDERPYLLTNKIVHFGSQYQWTAWQSYLAKSNRMVCTFFHGVRGDDEALNRHVDAFLASLPRLMRVITAAKMIEDRLLGWGVPRNKLVRIPIGVDTSLFKPVSKQMREEERAKRGIRPDQFVLGSFQKDGVGWGDGMEPKTIKGPDILIEVAKKIAKEMPLVVMLTGPARGYVMRELERSKIPYIHEFVDNYLDLPSRFSVLDAYINPSREEGGPKGILESMASGVPVVSAKVGMAPDVITHGATGMLHDVGDVENMAASVISLAQSAEFRSSLAENARQNILDYDWKNVALMHYDLVYRPMMEK